MSLFSSRAGEVNVALSPDRLVAYLPQGRNAARRREASRHWVRSLTAPANGLTWGNLAEVLEALRETTGGRTLHVALLAPLAHFRRLDLAGLSEAEAVRIVGHDPSRFVASPGRPELVVALEGAGWRCRPPFALSAVSSMVLEELGEAARAAGWSLGSVRPAPFAWAAAAARRRRHDCVACLATHIEVIRCADGMPLTYRRLRTPPGELTVAALRASLLERGLDVEPDATIMLSPDEAMAVAAEYVSRGAGPLVLPRRERVDARLRLRRGTSARLLTAALLLVLSAALEMWDVKRERTNVTAARMRIQRSLSEARAVRESLSVVNERLGAIRSLDSNAPHWSTWVARLAERLPPDAFLVSLSAAGDSLRLEGAATRAAPVFDALSAVPGVRNVRPDGPIRQEVRGGDAASEHFLISASLDRREMAAAGRTP